MSFVRFLISYYRIKQALHWWSSRQSMKLFLEAEKIRDGLLQQSFTIRRNLHLLARENLNLTNDEIPEYLKQIDNFHHSLVELSDRLFPASLQDSFPLAIECLLERWIAANPHLQIQIELPLSWRYEPAERGLIVLMSLEELLLITSSNHVNSVSIHTSLKQQESIGQLIVKITYPDVSTFVFYSRLPELDYLCESFRFLTSGKCFYHSQNLKVTWCFFW